LELVQINIQGTIETKGGRDRGDDLSYQTVQVLKRGARNIEVAAADIVNSLVVDQERAVRVLDRRVRAQDSVVWLNNGCGDAGCGIDGEFELGFLAVIGGEALEEEGAEARSSSTTKGVEDQEPLKRRAVVLEWSALPNRGTS